MGKRPKYSEEDIEHQLSQLYLFRDLLPSDSTSDSLVQLAPVIRSIAASQQQDAYLRHIRGFVNSKEHEIEQVCKANYQDFVTTTDKLLKVRQGTVSLKHRVVELNEDIQSKGGELAAKKRTLLDNRRVGHNIDETIDTLQACLRVLDLFTKITKLIEDKKYYSALRSIEDLQHIHLKSVLHLPFAQHMLSTLPATVHRLREAVTREMKSWLFEAREASRAIGNKALDSMDQRDRRWRARKAKDTDGSLRSAKVNGSVELAFSERYEVNYLETETVNLQFQPLYQCVLIHDMLEAREELQQSYSEDRRAQAALLLGSAVVNPLKIEALDVLLEETAGFFVIEAHVLKTTNTFRPDQEVDELTEGMVNRIIGMLAEGFRTCTDPEIYLQAKLRVRTFSLLLESLDFVTTPLNTFIESLFPRFADILERKFSKDFEQIINEDENQAMVVNDTEDFDKVASVSWLPINGPWSEASLRQCSFPLALPFSQTYPLCCIDVRNYVDQYTQYVEDHNTRSNEVDEQLRKSLDRLLTDRISLKIRNRIKTTTNLSQLAPVVINLLFFETACCELEILLGSLKDPRYGNNVVQLASVNSFRETLEMARTAMDNQIGSKLDNLFDLADYQWTPAYVPSPQVVEEPSMYLTEMVDYLTLVMDSVLVQLPEVFKAQIYRTALQHCSDCMLEYLIGSDPSRINDTGLSFFAVDVRYIAQHASNVPMERMDDVFEELSQMVALLQSDTPRDFLDPDFRNLAFNRVQGKLLEFALIKVITYYNDATPGQVDPKRKRDMEEVLKAVATAS